MPRLNIRELISNTQPPAGVSTRLGRAKPDQAQNDQDDDRQFNKGECSSPHWPPSGDIVLQLPEEENDQPDQEQRKQPRNRSTHDDATPD